MNCIIVLKNFVPLIISVAKKH